MASKRGIAASMAAALLLSLTACGSSERARVERIPNLALACQTMECTCSADTGTLFEKTRTTEILWRRDGEAYCPEGFVLEPVKRKP